MPPDQKASRGLFLEPIRRVVSQVHAVLTISNEAVNFLDLQLFQFLQRTCSSNLTTVDEMRDVIVGLLPEEIAEWALREAAQVVAAAEAMKAAGSTSKKGVEGVAFPAEILTGTTYFMSAVPEPEACLFLMSIIEYLCADILKLAGNYAENHHRKIIDVGDIRATLRLDPPLQTLFVKVRSDLLLSQISKQEERVGRYMSLVLKVIADCTKPIKEHGFIEMFANCTKAMNFHNELSKILSGAVGYPGLIQVIELLQANKQFFMDYAKEFEKSAPEIDTWRNAPNNKKMLEDRDLGRSVEHHLRRLLWQPLSSVILILTSLTNLIHLMPTEQSLLALAKEFSGLLSDFNEIARKYECETEADQDWRTLFWRHIDYTELQSKMEGWTGKSLTSLETKLCREGTLGAISVTGGVRKDKKAKERIFWLFDKILISGKPADFMTTKKGFFYEVKEIINVNTLTIREAVPDLEDAKFAFEVVLRDQESTIIVAKSEKERAEWLAAFYREITWAKLAYALEKVLMQEAFQGPELPPALRLTEAEYRFAVPDSPENILFEVNETGGVPLIKGGTVLKLVERLTFDKYADTNYLLQFLLTYRSFMEPLELLNLLIERFNYPTPKSASEEELEYFRSTIRRPVQLRVTNVVKNWVDKHYLDFHESKELLKRFLEFVKDDISSAQEMEKVVASLTKAIRKKREDETEQINRKSFVLNPNETIPEPITVGVSSGFLDIMELDPLEVARQLTLIEDKYYKAIPPHECLNQRWAKKNKEKEAPNILTIIERFNKVSNWVKTFVVHRKEFQARVEVIERFIKIAEKCMEINNFNAMTEIISGLNSIPVNRLRLTWAAITKKSLTSFQDMAALMAPEKNYRKFRKHLHTRDPPCMPYFGVYLTDLTFIDDGNKDLIPGTDLINFGKRRKTAAVISEIQQYQNLWFKFHEIPELQEYLLDLHIEDDEDCYQRSLEIEPRGATRLDLESSSSGTLERSSSSTDVSKSSEAPQGPKDQARKPSLPNIAMGRSLSSFGSMLKNVSVATSTAITKVGDSINEAKAKSDQKKEAKDKAKAEPISTGTVSPSASLEDFQKRQFGSMTSLNSTASTSSLQLPNHPFRKKSEEDLHILSQSPTLETRERTPSAASTSSQSGAPPIPYRDRTNLN